MLPAHTGFGLTDTAIEDGIWFTVTAVVVALALQPLLVTITVYTPDMAVVMPLRLQFCAAE